MVFRDFPRISPWGYNNISQGCSSKMGVRVIIVDDEKRGRFTCPFCSQVFNKPHQAECGDRYCEACFNKLTATVTTE